MPKARSRTRLKKMPEYYPKSKEKSPPNSPVERYPFKALKDITNVLDGKTVHTKSNGEKSTSTEQSTPPSSPLWDRDFKSPGKRQVDQESVIPAEEILSNDPFDIRAEDLRVFGNAKIGEGRFGEVFKALWTAGSREVAVKVTPRRNSEHDLSEVNICRRLRHPSVIQLIGCAKTENSIFMVMDYILGGNLELALGLNNKEPVSNGKLQILDGKYNGYVLYTAAQGLDYLHEKGIIHQDIKPANIMIEDLTKKAIICDLGLAVSVKDMTPAFPRKGRNPGTLRYQHREQIAGISPTRSVDVYAFAVLALEVCARKRAWSGMPDDEIIMRIREGEYPSIPNNHLPGEVHQLVTECFQEANKRPTVPELFPLLKSIVGRAAQGARMAQW